MDGSKMLVDVVGVDAKITWKIPIMLNKSMAISTSSPLLLESFVAYDWYAFFDPSSFVVIIPRWDQTFQP